MSICTGEALHCEACTGEAYFGEAALATRCYAYDAARGDDARLGSRVGAPKSRGKYERSSKPVSFVYMFGHFRPFKCLRCQSKFLYLLCFFSLFLWVPTPLHFRLTAKVQPCQRPNIPVGGRRFPKASVNQRRQRPPPPRSVAALKGYDQRHNA